MNLYSIFYLVLVYLLGILSTFLLPLQLRKWQKLAIGPALGIVIAAQLTLVISLIFGFQTVEIIISLAIYAVCLGFILKNNFSLIPLIRHISLITLKRLIRTDWPLFLILLTAGSVVFFIFWTKVLFPTEYGLATGGGGLYGDTALHSAYTTAIVEQGLPPQNPLFAGKVLVYPFMVNFFAAILVKLGSNLRFAFILPQLMYFLGFVTLFYKVAKKFSGNSGAFLAMLIFFLGWGLGFTNYINDSLTNHIWQITREYTNNMSTFNMHNVLTGLIFPERSFLPGLFIGMLITWIIINLNSNKKFIIHHSSFIIIGILLGILPLWHTHTFLFFGVSIGFWLLLIKNIQYPKWVARAGEPQKRGAPCGLILGLASDRTHNRCQKITSIIVIYGIAFIIALPSLLWIQKQVSHSSFLHFSMGWLNSGPNFLYFWWANSGLLIPLFIIGLIVMPKAYRLFFLPAILIFVIANFVTFQPWDWDNIKLLSWAFLFFTIPVGLLLSRLFTQKILFPLFPFISLLSLITLIASGTLSVIPYFSQSFTIYDHEDQDLALWIKNNTKPADVFLIDPQPTHPVPGLTGRSVYLGYPGHLWVHGIDYYKRENFVKQVLAGNLSDLSKAEVKIDYLVSGQNNAFNLNGGYKPHLVFQNNKYYLYKLL